MLALRIRDEYLELDNSTSLNITISNPVFDSENIARSFSYPFRIPLSAHNRRLLYHSNRIDDASQNIQTTAKLYLGGNLFESGILETQKASEKYIEAVFRNANLSVLSDLENVRLKDVMGFDIIQATTSTSANPVFDILQIDGSIAGAYSIIVEGNIFSLSTNTSMSAEYIAEYFAQKINEQLPNHAIWQVGQKQLVFRQSELPPYHFFLFYVGFRPVTNVTAGQGSALDVETYVHEINQNPVPTHAFPVLRWYNFYENNPIFEEWINYSLDGITIQNDLQPKKQWKHTYIPFVRLLHAVESLMSAVGLSLNLNTSSFWETEAKEMLIWNNRTIDSLFVPFSTQQEFINQFQRIIKFGEHVPDMSGKEFLLALGKQFELYFSVQGGAISFVEKSKQILQRAIDWTHKAEEEHTISYTTNKGYTIQQENQYDQYKAQEQLLPYRSGDGSEIITLPFGAPYMGSHNGLYIPIVSQRGTFYATTTSITGFDPATGEAITETDTLEAENPYDLRLLTFKGLVPNNTGQLYPQATNENLSPAELHEKYHRAYIDISQNKTIERNIRLHPHEILEIRRWENAKRRIYHRNGETTAIIKTLNFKVDIKKISVATVEFFSLT